MAILFVDTFSENKNKIIQSVVRVLEILLLLAGAITTLLMVKGAVIPNSCQLVFTSLMGFWNTTKCLLSSPLYISIIINLMVVIIAVSSNFQHHETENNNHDDGVSVKLHEHEIKTFQPQTPLRNTKISTNTTLYTNQGDSRRLLQNYKEKSILSLPKPLFPKQDITQELKKTTRSLKLTSGYVKPKMGTKVPSFVEAEVNDYYLNEKENENEDTLDATWKLITGGGDQTPKKKELRKSDTFTNNVEARTLDYNEVVPSVKRKEFRKSETFNDTASVTRHGGLRRDPSESIDEFNNQVEAFINKFNADMRLQRQKSDQRFLEMINEGL